VCPVEGYGVWSVYWLYFLMVIGRKIHSLPPSSCKVKTKILWNSSLSVGSMGQKHFNAINLKKYILHLFRGLLYDSLYKKPLLVNKNKSVILFSLLFFVFRLWIRSCVGVVYVRLKRVSSSSSFSSLLGLTIRWLSISEFFLK
jgi:hypothetical protein